MTQLLNVSPRPERRESDSCHTAINFNGTFLLDIFLFLREKEFALQQRARRRPASLAARVSKRWTALGSSQLREGRKRSPYYPLLLGAAPRSQGSPFTSQGASGLQELTPLTVAVKRRLREVK